MTFILGIFTLWYCYFLSSFSNTVKLLFGTSYINLCLDIQNHGHSQNLKLFTLVNVKKKEILYKNVIIFNTQNVYLHVNFPYIQ